jgi:hypothetical protein
MKSHTMTRSPITSVRTLAWVAAVMLLLAAAALATNVAEPRSAGQGLGFPYDQSREITLTGTLQQLVTHPAKGTPMGLHLLVSTDGNVVDAHVGPYLSKANQEALRVGQPIQIVGVNENVHGKNVLLARQLVYGGRQVNVRNERGLLLLGTPAVRHHGPSKISDGKRLGNGGNQ